MKFWGYFAFLLASIQVWAQEVRLPTDNRALFEGKPEQFYMYTDREFEGVRSKPWQGGLYGFSRNQKRYKNEIVMTRFHEGVDIRPIRRDENNEPLDMIRPIAKGKVVYANTVASKSSYGKYLVIEHETETGPLYSLYAHLAEVFVKKGKKVDFSTEIARLGYTGNGINRERAHLHLELNLMISKDFEKWHEKQYPEPSEHKEFNGINLTGIPIYEFFQTGELPDMRQFKKRLKPYYSVIVKRSKKKPSILKNYPWLLDGLELVDSPSWEITFTGSGIPLKMVPSQTEVSEKYPQISNIYSYSKHPHEWQTKSRVTGSGSKAYVTPSGVRFFNLFTENF